MLPLDDTLLQFQFAVQSRGALVDKLASGLFPSLEVPRQLGGLLDSQHMHVCVYIYIYSQQFVGLTSLKV